MNRSSQIWIGLFLCVTLSWVCMVLVPHLQLGALGMVNLEETGEDYPLALPGGVRQGREVYQANGCWYCHTQVVRGGSGANDIARNWGKRRTVARDSIRQQPALLGSLRLGPDLANVGARTTNTQTLLLQLFNPRIVTSGSTMPRHAFLFDERVVDPAKGGSSSALPLSGRFAPSPGREVVPKPEALLLVQYLRSLKAETMFFEAYPASPAPATNPVSAP